MQKSWIQNLLLPISSAATSPVPLLSLEQDSPNLSSSVRAILGPFAVSQTRAEVSFSKCTPDSINPLSKIVSWLLIALEIENRKQISIESPLLSCYLPLGFSSSSPLPSLNSQKKPLYSSCTELSPVCTFPSSDLPFLFTQPSPSNPPWVNQNYRDGQAFSDLPEQIFYFRFSWHHMLLLFSTHYSYSFIIL